MVKQLYAVPHDAVRNVDSESLEAVLPLERMRNVLPILGKYFGAPLKPPAQSPTAEMKEVAGPCGGIREDQTLYYSERKGKFEFAALWPWKDGEHVTLKILAGARSSLADPALRGKQESAEKNTEVQVPIAEVQNSTIEVLVLGPQMQWAGNILKILGEDGFKVRAEYGRLGLDGLFRQKEYAPQAVLLYLSRMNWPGPEVVPQIKAQWPETKLLVYAESDMPWRISLNSIRDADLFHRGHEDWAQLGGVIKKVLQQRYDTVEYKRLKVPERSPTRPRR
jgi:hypothetical protein